MVMTTLRPRPRPVPAAELAPVDDGRVAAALTINGAALVADLSGALWWPDRQLLAVADLHLEKGSGYAATGRPLPPYDTRATLDRLTGLLDRYAPKTVLCLGDSFHDTGAADRVGRDDAGRLKDLTARADWRWLVGNHDPTPPDAWGGTVHREVVIGPLVFRHQARPSVGGEVGGEVCGEISGHWHPKAYVPVRAGRMSGDCFVTDGRRLILPAFGAFTGGLNVRDPNIAALFPDGFSALVAGRSRLHRFDGRHLLPDPPRGAMPKTKRAAF